MEIERSRKIRKKPIIL